MKCFYNTWVDNAIRAPRCSSNIQIEVKLETRLFWDWNYNEKVEIKDELSRTNKLEGLYKQKQ